MRNKLKKIKVTKELDIQKILYSLSFINIVQIGVALYIVFSGGLFSDPFSAIIGVVSIIGAVISMQTAAAFKKMYIQNLTYEKAIIDLESYNQSMRAQRHDFKNHLQVISALIDMDEMEESKIYLRKITEDLTQVSRAQKTKIPAVNALIAAKLALCQRDGILMELDITSSLDSVEMESWELCRILGNLIDNAVDASKNINKIGYIKIQIFDNPDATIIRIINNGKKISEELQSKIFLPGFSTKGDDRGMGLSIVQSIVEHNDGKLLLSSSEQATTFDIILTRTKVQKG